MTAPRVGETNARTKMLHIPQQELPTLFIMVIYVNFIIIVA